MSEKYSFGLYPNFAYFSGSWDNGNLRSQYPDEFEKIKSFKFKHHRKLRSLVAFPGFEKQLVIEDFSDSAEQYGQELSMITLVPKLLDFGKNYNESRNFIADSGELNFDDDSILAADYMRHAIAKIAKSMVETSYYWDEKVFFRFYALNEFCADSVFNDKTFGSFIEENMDELYSGFRLGKSDMNTYTKDLLNHYEQTGALLYYSGKILETINSFTKDEIAKVLKRDSCFFPSNSSFEKDFVKEFTVDTIIQDKRTVSFEEIDDKAVELFNRILDFYGIDYNSINPEISEIFQAGQLMDGTFALIYNYEIYEYLTNLEKAFYEVEPITLIPMLFTLDSNNVFMGDNGETFSYIRSDLIFGKVAKVVNTFFKDKTLPNSVFINFLNATLMEYDGCVPTYEEWMKFIEEGGTFSSHIPPSILLPMLLEKSDNVNREMEYVKRYRIYMNELKEIIDNKTNGKVVVLSAGEEKERMKKIFNKSDNDWYFERA